MKYRKYVILAAISGFSVCVDQITKMYIHTRFQYGESVNVIAQFFDLTYVRNQGAAFGIFSTADPMFRTIFFLSLPPIAMICIFSLLKNLPKNDLLQTVALSSIFGGALGNYIDRIRFGYVIDFLDFHYKRVYSYPAFNVADMCIVGGVIILLFVILAEWSNERKQGQTLATKK